MDNRQYNVQVVITELSIAIKNKDILLLEEIRQMLHRSDVSDSDKRALLVITAHIGDTLNIESRLKQLDLRIKQQELTDGKLRMKYELARLFLLGATAITALFAAFSRIFKGGTGQ